jgi:hypothetical protein
MNSLLSLVLSAAAKNENEKIAGRLFSDIAIQAGKKEAERIFLETLKRAASALEPDSELDAYEKIAVRIFAIITKHFGRLEAERIFRKLTAPIKRDLIRLRTQLWRELYDDYVLKRGWPVLRVAKQFGGGGLGEVGAIHKYFCRLEEKRGISSRRPGRPRAG